MRIIGPVVAAVLTGCTTMPINYVPSTEVRGAMPLELGVFRYIPAEQGKVHVNQFQQNSASIGWVFVEEDVPAVIRTALRKELSYAGYDLGGSDALEISGDITRFFYGWLGFLEIEIEVAITFRVTKAGEVLLEVPTFSRQAAPKTSVSRAAEAFRTATTECIDRFISEAHKRGVL